MVYCLWTVLGGDPSTVVDALVVLLASVPLYPFFIRSMAAVAEQKRIDVSPSDAARYRAREPAAVGGKAPRSVEPQPA